MARVPLVGVNTTVRAVGPTAGLGCLLDDDVLDDEVALVEVLRLRVGLCVLEQAQDELDALLRPAALHGLERLGLRRPPDAAAETAERDHLLVLVHVGEVAVGLFQLQACVM